MAVFSQLFILNKRKDIADITVDKIEQYDLSAEEQNFLIHYKPENKLIIYGTLAPGKPNHHKMTHIKGEWKTAIIKGGKLESEGWGAELGFNGFVLAEEKEQIDIPCYVLFSDNLSEHWKSLDTFEGEGYRRILANYELEDGHKGVAYLYAINK